MSLSLFTSSCLCELVLFKLLCKLLHKGAYYSNNSYYELLVVLFNRYFNEFYLIVWPVYCLIGNSEEYQNKHY